jgi:alpha-tubulin suppressor-like RCC1 family protein
MTAATTTPIAGTTDNLSITALDAYGNTATSYTGAHNITFSGAGSIRTYDPTVTNNAGTATKFGTATTITFTNGVSSAGGVMTLYRAQTANIVASDGAHNNGSGLQITVIPAALNALSLAAEKVVVRPGATDQLTVRAIDTYGNTASGYGDGAHNLTFSGGTGTRTVTNSAGTQVAFGNQTSINFTNSISTTGGVMRINDLQTANVTVSDGVRTSVALRIVVSSVSASMVSAGSFHTCALVGGFVECWGNNDYGQLGDGTTTQRTSPVKLASPTNVTQISAGKYHTCALRSDGTVYCWGQNSAGELGDGTLTDRSSPVQVQASPGVNLTDVAQVSSGGRFTCALMNNGTIRCWGYGPFGQMGNGTTGTNNPTPVQVSGITTATQISAGMNHACALLSGGTVDCWGFNRDQQYANSGQLGDGTTVQQSSVPVHVLDADGTGTLTGVAQIGTGRFHSCARMTSGTVYCWGDNESGELGNGSTTNSSIPVQVTGITTASTISAGAYHSCAVLQDGTAQCWGAAAFGQVGDGTTADASSPVTVIGPGGWGSLTGVATIGAGGGNDPDTNNNWEHTCALLVDGTVVCWGYNNNGQLGDGTTTTSISPVGVALL